jgi:hypothetical protein
MPSCRNRKYLRNDACAIFDHVASPSTAHFTPDGCSSHWVYFTERVLTAFLPPGCRHSSMPLALTPHQTRLFSSSGDDGGWFGGLKKAAKSILPKSWTQTEERAKSNTCSQGTRKMK